MSLDLAEKTVFSCLEFLPVIRFEVRPSDSEQGSPKSDGLLQADRR